MNDNFNDAANLPHPWGKDGAVQTELDMATLLSAHLNNYIYKRKGKNSEIKIKYTYTEASGVCTPDQDRERTQKIAETQMDLHDSEGERGGHEMGGDTLIVRVGLANALGFQP